MHLKFISINVHIFCAMFIIQSSNIKKLFLISSELNKGKKKNKSLKVKRSI